jgi:hypothetical protein
VSDATDVRRTGLFVLAACLLATAAWLAGPRPGAPAALAGRGQPFFPEFTDPNRAASLEVVEFDEQTSAARPFKVMNREGRWTIPSHQHYPADGANRLPSIAAAVIALKKDDVAGDNVADHERCGVLDPLDETLATPRGRGTRITVRGTNDAILADIIRGRAVEGRPHLRYVRLPGERRVYVARLDDLQVSTRFEDWIERNLLQVDRNAIDQIAVRNYTADAKTGQVSQREAMLLRRRAQDVWDADGARPGETIDTFTMNLLVTKLVELSIVDVRAKPPEVTATLSRTGGARLTAADVSELSSRGFYFTSDGRLLSNQGEVLVHTDTGVFYALRFGELAPGATPEKRYLFISVGLDPSATGGVVPPEVRARLEVLQARFAPWYYLISDDSFRKIRVERRALIRPARP